MACYVAREDGALRPIPRIVNNFCNLSHRRSTWHARANNQLPEPDCLNDRHDDASRARARQRPTRLYGSLRTRQSRALASPTIDELRYPEPRSTITRKLERCTTRVSRNGEGTTGEYNVLGKDLEIASRRPKHVIVTAFLRG